MNYLSIYQKVLETNNEGKLIDILKETGNWQRLKAQHLEIIEDEPLSYILVTVDHQNDYSGYFAAAMIGIYLEKSFIAEIDGNYEQDYFYLPIIAKPDKLPEIAKDYYSEENAVKHELIHISDILRWIEDKPEYIENAIRYSYEAATEENIDKSIDFEVEKIFRLEPQAMDNDFDNGENMIIEPFIFGIYMKYECKTKSEFVKIKIADYVINLKNIYAKNFSDKKDSIERFFEKSIARYGKKIFGNKPCDKLKKVNKGKVDKLLKYSLKR